MLLALHTSLADNLYMLSKHDLKPQDIILISSCLSVGDTGSGENTCKHMFKTRGFSCHLVKSKCACFLWVQDAYRGLLSADQFAADFTRYAQTVVSTLGERVTYYTTINEPDTICSQGYKSGTFAPGMLSCYQIMLDIVQSFLLFFQHLPLYASHSSWCMLR